MQSALFRTIVTLLPMLLVFFAVVSAPESAFAAVRTWQESLRLAAQNNSEIQAAEASLRATVEQESAALGSYFPQVSASASGTKSAIAPSPSASAESINEAATTYAATLNITQNIFNGFQDAAKHQQAKLNVSISRAALRTSKAKVSYDLKNSYAVLRFAESYFQLTDDIIRRRQENLKLVQLRFQSGRENRGSLLLSQSNLEQGRFDHLLAQNARETSRLQLARTLGLDESTSLEVKDDVPLNAPSARDPDFESLVLLTPELEQARAQEAVASENIRATRGSFLPTLNLAGSMGRQSNEFFPQTERWSLGVTLTIPIFTGGKNAATYRSATESRTAAQRTLENLLRVQRTNLRQAYATYIEAVAKLKVDQSYLEAAKLRAEIARGKYNNGLLNFDEWDLIENALIDRQKKYLESRRDRILAEAAWERATGQGAIP